MPSLPVPPELADRGHEWIVEAAIRLVADSSRSWSGCRWGDGLLQFGRRMRLGRRLNGHRQDAGPSRTGTGRGATGYRTFCGPVFLGRVGRRGRVLCGYRMIPGLHRPIRTGRLLIGYRSDVGPVCSSRLGRPIYGHRCTVGPSLTDNRHRLSIARMSVGRPGRLLAGHRVVFGLGRPVHSGRSIIGYRDVIGPELCRTAFQRGIEIFVGYVSHYTEASACLRMAFS